jgi:predicted phosphodiesterase
MRLDKTFRPRLNKYVHGLIDELKTENVVGIIGDTHEPFCHKDYRDFCYETFNRFQVNKIVHIGDEVDNHALSYHENNSEAHSAASEADQAQEAMNKWYATFSEVSVIVGNHSALPYRKATTAGLPKRFIKTYEEIWEAPEGWKWHMELDIDYVKYIHGMGSSGQNGAINRAIRSRQSTVIGHIHSFGGVNYHANENDIIFGLNVGCGIDATRYAFEYGKPFVNKPTLGCGIVVGGRNAMFIPMNLGKKYEWIK